MKKSGLLKIGLLISLSCLSSGCIFVAGAAAGAAAIAVVYDHRTLQNVWEDTKIANQIISSIKKIAALRLESHIEVTVFNRVALLTGETPNIACRQTPQHRCNQTIH